MQLFLLGAGRPAIGNKPTALKHIALNTKAMDWQLHSFENFVEHSDVHFLGGYHIDEVKNSYPNLNITYIPNWEDGGVLHTLLSAPFSNKEAMCAYSDTMFRKSVVDRVNSIDSDVVVCVDSLWKSRFDGRTKQDIETAETITVDGRLHEFTGLIKFSQKVSLHLADIEANALGRDLLDLISYIKRQGFSVNYHDIAGEWAEFNSPEDISRFILGTKAETLARLKPLVKTSYIASQVSFTTAEWYADAQRILDKVLDKYFSQKLVVRSSSKGEDNWNSSNAGGFESILNVDGSDPEEVESAIVKVKDSYGDISSGEDQILVQPFLSDAQMSGVVFTCSLESGAPYYRFNFDDKSSSTESVTSGMGAELRTILVSRLDSDTLKNVEPALEPVLTAIKELESLLGFDKLDIEFAVDKKGVVHIFQVRPLTVSHEDTFVEEERVKASLKSSVDLFQRSRTCPPTLYGDKTIYANMPDWNPAEIIGTRPKPLAFSLYRQLITNDVWAQQRAEFGYKDVRPLPLIVSFSGQPYVDTRASLTSFLPKELSGEASSRIVNAYLSILSDNPNYHDKVEFEVAFTIWTLNFDEMAKERLIPYGVTDYDIAELSSGLKRVTKDAFARLESDTSSIQEMTQRREAIINSGLSRLDKAYALLDDCKRYGTLAFSHAARAGFVANTTLNSMVDAGVLTENRKLEFLRSFSTVAGEFEQDKRLCGEGKLTQESLVSKYGHLRPGTYEISQSAYWESPEQFFVLEAGEVKQEESFTLLSEERLSISKMLKELDLEISVDAFMEYLSSAIKARESVKFDFTKNLSKSLDYVVKFGEEFGIGRNDLSYLEYSDIEQLKLNAIDLNTVKDNISSRKNSYQVTSAVELPPFIISESDFYSFEKFASQPNFVTVNSVISNVAIVDKHEQGDLSGKIAIIPQADPGYDWLFGYNIGGLITKYGGANSHMAIRAAEIGLPAAIGVGDKLYEKFAREDALVELDCANKLLRLLQ